MASTYSTNLALELITTGEQAGTWGVNTNNNLGTLIEQAVSGYVTQAITDGADTVITIPNGATGVARNMTIECTGALTAARNLIVPSNRKLYFIYNNTTGGYAVTVKVSGQTGVSVPNGKKMLLVSNGTDVVEALTYSSVIAPSNPSATIGLTATNGTATTYMRSDAAPALSQSITPTWTGAHTFSNTTTINGTLAGTGVSAYFASPPAIGGTAAAAGTFTTLTANTSISGTGFLNYFASPPAIGGTAPNTGAFTTLSASSTVSGTGFTNYFAAPPAIGGTTPAAGTFTTLTATGNASAAALVPTGSSVPTNGFYYPSANTLAVATNGVKRETWGLGVQVGTPTGGDLGAGTLNASGLFVNGVPVAAVVSPPAGSTGQVQYNNGGAFGGLPDGVAGQFLSSSGPGVAPVWASGFTPAQAYFFAGF